MAPPNKKGFSIKFDLSLGGLLGVGVVCFCIFLWMFLLGVWAGQTGLIGGLSFPTPVAAPTGSTSAKVETTKRVTPPEPVAASEPEPPPVVTPAVPAPGPGASGVVAPAPVASRADAPGDEPSPPPKKSVEAAVPKAKASGAPFYAIQVGAFRDNKNVEDELRLWRDRGYESFSRPPGQNEHLTKVYVGHYSNAGEAKKQELILTKKRKISPLIVMIRPD